MKFSIVISVYNPLQEIFERVLTACAGLDFDKSAFETLIVDNNSSPALSVRDYVKPFLTGNTRCIEETRQGLTFARIAGIKSAAAETIVFVDDDNILDPDYLRSLARLFEEYPAVFAWGPGKIELDYIHGAPLWIRKNYAAFFQEKNKLFTQYGCVVGWPDYYPPGTGLAMKKEILLTYIQAFESGQLSFTGRSLNGLESAEDSQMIWMGVKKGLCAGTSPHLKLKHVIPQKRVSRAYLAKLNYALGYSYTTALLEMFPNMAGTIEKRSLRNILNLIVKLLLKAGGNPIQFYRYYSIDIGWFRGIRHGKIQAQETTNKTL